MGLVFSGVEMMPRKEQPSPESQAIMGRAFRYVFGVGPRPDMPLAEVVGASPL
jgi:hypothetical protein